MNTDNQTQKTTLKQCLQAIFRFLFIGLLFSLPSLLLAENHDHDHKAHTESEHKDDDDHQKKDNHKTDDNHDDHDKHDEHGHEEQSEHGEAAMDVELSQKQMKKAGIKTMRVKKRTINQPISALGEVKLNQYKTIKVSPSITTRIEKRHVKLGDQVKKNAHLVTLHTIATTDQSANILATADLTVSAAELAANIAEAKGELTAATASWKRVQSLGRDAVSGKRYTAARLAKKKAEAKLNAYSKSQAQVKKLLTSGSKAVQKHYELRAEQAGMVIKDDFVLGQIVTPEDVLFEISDMDHLWVEANIKPNEASKIAIDSTATILSNGKNLRGKVIFISRLLDEKTRTLTVRIEVNTTGASLYPGQFVKTRINSNISRSAMVIPAEAVLRSADGDWVLFVEEASGRFVPKEVEVIKNRGQEVIIKGIKTGTTIVSKGAFFVQSEMAKSGFEVHNH